MAHEISNSFQPEGFVDYPYGVVIEGQVIPILDHATNGVMGAMKIALDKRGIDLPPYGTVTKLVPLEGHPALESKVQQ